MSDPSPLQGLSTRCVHLGRRPLPGDAGLALPIDRSSTFLLHSEVQALVDAGRWDEALVYARYGSPTVAAVESKLAALEGAEEALLFGSGMAALHALLHAVTAPDEREGRKPARVAAARQLYGGSLSLLRDELEPRGMQLFPFDVDDPSPLDGSQGLRAVLVESLSNPTLRVADLSRLARLAHDQGALLIVDATFASPVLQRPLERGADLVVHSATKVLGGHSDLLAGVVAGGASSLAAVSRARRNLGALLDPAPAYLLERGLKTLALRVRAQTEGALTLARALERHPAVTCVHYPGLESHPDYTLAQEQLEGAGWMLAFELAGGDEELGPFVSRLRLATHAPSLGGVETLVSVPALLSHAALTPKERARAGIAPGLVRVSVGIEESADLVADFEAALAG